jgi:UDP-N-acetylmuramyl-tripeptide synthetase
MAKNLFELLALLPKAQVLGEAGKKIESITADSRKVGPGTLFVCLAGARVDGHDFIDQAHNLGAVAVVVEKDIPVPAGMTVIRVVDSREAMQKIVPFFYDYPGRKMRMIGVTGTNGKTTTTHLIRSIFMQAGYKVGLIGTIHILIGDRMLPVQNTTPDVVDLQSTLAEMAAEDVDYVIMEVSSHALELGRTAGCEFDVGVFTNLTQDHLDFHITFDKYRDAKAKLFCQLGDTQAVKQGKHAIINMDDASAAALLQQCSCPVITYGTDESSTIRAQEMIIKAAGAQFTVNGPFGLMPLQLKITGMFNVYNALAAISAAWAEGIESSLIQKALEEFLTVPGRFELVDEGQPYAVIVDYAHTPDGLENILKTAQQFAERRIIVVFGCGGDRDKTKRPIMGRLAALYGDVIIATSDNPRTEDPVAILADVEAGIRQGLANGKGYEVIVDRKQAIAKALQVAEPRDIVIIAGKGHETYQILKDKTIDFDDRQVARSIIREMR